MLVTSNLVK